MGDRIFTRMGDGERVAMPAEAVRLQYWVGESAWQGRWKPLSAALEQSEDTWSWRIGSKDQPTGTVCLSIKSTGIVKIDLVVGIAAKSF